MLVVTDSFGEERTIGKDGEFLGALDFIISELSNNPKLFLEKGGFVDYHDMFSYLFENVEDEIELTGFLKDYYDGVEE